MARKRLIKGANAVRVEERIARVPVDVSLPQFEPGSGIFDALRAMEAPKVVKAPAERSGAAVQGRSPRRKPAPVSPSKPQLLKGRRRGVSPTRVFAHQKNSNTSFYIAQQTYLRKDDSGREKDAKGPFPL